MTPADLASYREAAERCRRLAAEATDPVEKQELLHIADGWLALSPELVLALNRLAVLYWGSFFEGFRHGLSHPHYSPRSRPEVRQLRDSFP